MEAELLEKRSLRESRPGLFIQRLLSARTEWKRKCREAKETLQAQRVRIRDLEASRDHWRAVAEQAQRDLQRESVQQTAQVEKK
jgi:TRAP-type C4-dicarboxylate transport system substrate-binding protein